MEELDLLPQIFVFLLAAIISVTVGKYFGLNSVFGYTFAGIIIGPWGLGIITNAQEIQHFAEFGIVIMFFLAGLEIKPRIIWELRTRVFGLGILQLTATTILISSIFLLLEVHWKTSIFIGLICSLSSSSIALQTIREQALSKTKGGAHTTYVVFFQTFATIFITMLIPFLLPSNLQVESGESIWSELFLILFSISLLLLGSNYLFRLLFKFTIKAKLREIKVAGALLLIIGISIIMSAIGLPTTFGAFIVGVALANSEFRNSIASDLEPFKSLLVGLFFFSVGVGLNLGHLAEKPVMIITLSFSLILLKLLVLLGMSYALKLNNKDRWVFSLSLAPAGELGLVLLSYGITIGVIQTDFAQIIATIITISMVTSIWILRAAEKRIGIEGLNSNSSTPLKVFISYSRKDIIKANRLYSRLELDGFDTFLDLRDLPYGEEWQKELDRSIQQSDVIVWLISKNSIQSRWCNWELSKVTEYSKRLIPVLIEKVEVDLLPAELKKLQMFPRSEVLNFNDPSQLGNLTDTLSIDHAWLKEYTYLGRRAILWSNDGCRPYWLLRKNELVNAKIWLQKLPDTEQEIDAIVLDLINASETIEAQE